MIGSISFSMTGTSSGRGSRKFSKSAADQTRFSPAPFILRNPSPAPGLVMATQRS